MTRQAKDKERFSPFSRWVRKYCRDSSGGLCVTNLDFVFEDFHRRRLMLVEEKQHRGKLHAGQRRTFKELDAMVRDRAALRGYEYWGFYLLVLPGVRPEAGMTLNGVPATSQQLVDHLNFDVCHCRPLIASDEWLRGRVLHEPNGNPT